MRLDKGSRGRNRLGAPLCPLERARAVGTVVRWDGAARHRGGRRWGEGTGRHEEGLGRDRLGLGGNMAPD